MAPVERYRIDPGSDIDLASFDPDDIGCEQLSKHQVQKIHHAMSRELARLQQLLFAEAKHKVIVVLQGMDSSGKDGTIRRVFTSVDPLGVNVANFKRPSLDELAHDYLWRVHHHTPAKGFITIFNRSHYEDVLVPRVHSLVPEHQWKARYRHLVEFERMLYDEGAVILKFFLNISREEQGKRLQQRLENPIKQWKFEHGDINERRYWNEYILAYEDAISATSTVFAPWYIIPANVKWYRNIVILQVLIDSMQALEMSYPVPAADLPTTIDG